MCHCLWRREPSILGLDDAVSHDAPPDWLALYWGKARPRDESSPDWHPLAYHSLDVAAAMAAMLEARPAWLSAVADRSQLSVDEARLRLILAAALHDLGKFADNFQQKAPAEAPMVLTLTPTDDKAVWSAAWSDRKGARTDVTYSRSFGLTVK